MAVVRILEGGEMKRNLIKKDPWFVIIAVMLGQNAHSSNKNVSAFGLQLGKRASLSTTNYRKKVHVTPQVAQFSLYVGVTTDNNVTQDEEEKMYSIS